VFKQLLTLLRGAANGAASTVVRRNAPLLLDQQIHDAGAAIEVGRRALAAATVASRQEEQRAEAIASRIAGLEDCARAALAGGREDLALLAAETIAALEPEGDAADQALALLDREMKRLRQAVRDGGQRHAALQRGRRLVRLGHATPSGRMASTALHDAEQTLAALQSRQAAEDVLDELRESPGASEERLGEAGFGPATRLTGASVLARLKPLAITRT
jgi:phage shock protein A